MLNNAAADAVFAAQIGNRNAGLPHAPSKPDDLLFRKAAAVHGLIIIVGYNEAQAGSMGQGHRCTRRVMASTTSWRR